MITQRQIIEEEKEWEEQKSILKRKYKIEQEKRQLKNKYKKFTTTKLLIAFIFISCTLIEIFTGWITIQSLSLALVTGIAPDFSPLVGLIGAVVGEVFGFGIYAIKSLKENTKGGITYDSVMKDENNAVG